MEKYAFLVYQAGIANVFEVAGLALKPRGRKTRRLLQADFRTCEAFTAGLVAAGYFVRSAHCNQAGDIKGAEWSYDLDEAPFRAGMRPVAAN